MKFKLSILVIGVFCFLSSTHGKSKLADEWLDENSVSFEELFWKSSEEQEDDNNDTNHLLSAHKKAYELREVDEEFDEHEVMMFGNEEWLSAHWVSPEEQLFRSNLEMIEQEPMQFSVSSSDDWTELGGLVRPTSTTPIGEGTYLLLLLSLGYCFKCYHSFSKTKKLSKA